MVVSVQPALILCVGFYLYAISGPIITIRTVRKLKVAHVVGDDVVANVETVPSVQAAAQTQVVTDLEKEKQEEHKP